jgi:integrase
MKRNLKGVSENRLVNNHMVIQLMFLLMEKEHIEEITSQDCRKLCQNIYRVRKRWHERIKENYDPSHILSDNPKQTISKRTVRAHLVTFKEFMRYAVKEEIIQNSLSDFIDMPIKFDNSNRIPFTSADLRKIFNPLNYPDPHSRDNQAKFWIPIIALYHGCRQNEICQLDVDDIVMEKEIPCISINANAPDKSVKNKGSERVIPIHPKLIDMGFLYFVEYQRREHKIKLFDFAKIKRGLYNCQVQHWFARYLDKIGMSEPSKVFHSFRHTFETMATEKRIPPQYQNAICGWAEQGIGQRLYAHKKDVRVMLEEISKIEYPINRELNNLKKAFMDSYVMK